MNDTTQPQPTAEQMQRTVAANRAEALRLDRIAEAAHCTALEIVAHPTGTGADHLVPMPGCRNAWIRSRYLTTPA